MSMTLTRQDLSAIKQLIDGSIDERVPVIIEEHIPRIINEMVPKIINEQVPGIVQPMLDGLEQKLVKRMDNLEQRLVKRIDNLDDTLSRQMEHGLQEVRDQVQAVDTRLVGVEQTVEHIEQLQQAEIERVDDHKAVITRIRKTFTRL